MQLEIVPWHGPALPGQAPACGGDVIPLMPHTVQHRQRVIFQDAHTLGGRFVSRAGWRHEARGGTWHRLQTGRA